MNNLLIIDRRVLPDIFNKVIETKRLISSGEAKNATEAVKMTGISRSAYYKYKDFVFPYNGNSFGQVITLKVVLSDRPGVLSSFITQLYRLGANILTVNQDIPSGGTASVSVTLSCEHVKEDLDLAEKVRVLDGVISLHQAIE